MPSRDSLSIAQARRIALAAQGFARSRRRPSVSALRALIADLGAVQIDSVNVLVRSHYLPAFSRLGPYDRALLDRAAYAQPRRAFEYMGHEASILPIDLFPFFRWRMEDSRHGINVWRTIARVGLERKDLVRRVREAFHERGPLGASDFDDEKSTGSWWGWTDTKRAVEYLFWSGEISPAKRRTSFERVYDLTERIIPATVRNRRVAPDDAYRALIEQGARAMGIATEADLRDYFRLPLSPARSAVGQLVDSGVLRPVRVEGWKQPAYLYRDARVPRAVGGSALLSPFDSLVWNRDRVHRLFNFHYRIEIYTPAHKRLHGYYVLPYLLDERLAARVDLKADRGTSALLVQGFHVEPGIPKVAVRTRLRDDLRAMADWLNLETVIWKTHAKQKCT